MSLIQFCHARSSDCLGCAVLLYVPVTALGVLCCFALFVCLTLLASLSLIRYTIYCPLIRYSVIIIMSNAW